MLALLACLSFPPPPPCPKLPSKSFLLTTPVTLGSSGSNASLNHSPPPLSVLALNPSFVIVGTPPAPIPPLPSRVEVRETEVATEAVESARFILDLLGRWEDRGAATKPRMSWERIPPRSRSSSEGSPSSSSVVGRRDIIFPVSFFPPPRPSPRRFDPRRVSL
jgi:hypothetical protein